MFTEPYYEQIIFKFKLHKCTDYCWSLFCFPAIFSYLVDLLILDFIPSRSEGQVAHSSM